MCLHPPSSSPITVAYGETHFRARVYILNLQNIASAGISLPPLLLPSWLQIFLLLPCTVKRKVGKRGRAVKELW